MSELGLSGAPDAPGARSRLGGPSAADEARSWRAVVKGPGRRDCWLWTGAIAEDGYGRFWVKFPGRAGGTVRPHRFAFCVLFDVDLDAPAVVEHAVCDNPICVRVGGDELDHLIDSTQAANLRRMGERGRGGGAWIGYRWRGTDRASLAARSRRLREAVKDGWDYERIADAHERAYRGPRR